LIQNIRILFWLLLLLVHEFFLAAPYILPCTCACVMTEREGEKKENLSVIHAHARYTHPVPGDTGVHPRRCPIVGLCKGELIETVEEKRF